MAFSTLGIEMFLPLPRPPPLACPLKQRKRGSLHPGVGENVHVLGGWEPGLANLFAARPATARARTRPLRVACIWGWLPA